MIELKGITWDHPRGYDSIVAATTEFQRNHSEFKLIWHARSLKDFGDQPISSLVSEYDLLMIDHPFVGEAHTQKLLLPLAEILSVDFLSAQSNYYAGPCFKSYRYANHQYALPVDAATQVSAFNPNVFSASNIPKYWKDYLKLMKDQRFKNKVLWPLCPTDLWCSFLTIAAQLGNLRNATIFLDEGLNIDLAEKSLEFLKELTNTLIDECWHMNPINVLEAMNSSNDLGFSPLLFGYNNYSRPPLGNVQFTDAIGHLNQPPIALIGGVGIAVSRQTHHKKAIGRFLNFIMQDHIVSGSYFEAGGQPALKSVWKSEKINNGCRNFFWNTAETIENAYVRPRRPGFNNFQEEASVMLHEQFRTGKARSIVEGMSGLYLKNCES
jgi:multiple sugar transport system substrate-binding protein